MQKVNPGRSVKYRSWIASKPCSVCGHQSPSDPHHVQKEGHGTMGGKTCDSRCLPLCWRHHHAYHVYGRKSFATRNPYWNPEVLIEQFKSLWLLEGGKAFWEDK